MCARFHHMQSLDLIVCNPGLDWSLVTLFDDHGTHYSFFPFFFIDTQALLFLKYGRLVISNNSSISDRAMATIFSRAEINTKGARA